MNENRKPNRWRSCVVKIAVLCLVWTLLATTFAAQFYWLGQDWLGKVSWKHAFLGALVQWCPWMVLSPAVVWLAERCRFDHARWLWGIFPHLPACVVVALGYQGISMVLMQYVVRDAPQSIFGGTDLDTISSGVLPDFASDANLPPDASPLPGVIIQSANSVAANQAANGDAFVIGRATVPDAALSLPLDAIPPGSPSAGAIQVIPSQPAIVENFDGAFEVVMLGPWTRFLHLAVARAQYTIPIYWTIVCITWVISYYQQLRARERRTLELEARLMQASLQTLKAQLQPHFLFNTLNTIASFVRRKPLAAEDMIGSLSDLLRMNLEVAQQHEVPLWREIKFLDLYLDIQQIRFGERLQIQKEINPTALEVAVPTLILQPIVENSVLHGIEARETGGTILIRALRLGNSLRLEVRDDGEGLQGGQLAAIREGIGLSNTKSRLQELYGDAHRFLITPNADAGLTVTVELPWRAAAVDGGNPGLHNSRSVGPDGQT